MFFSFIFYQNANPFNFFGKFFKFSKIFGSNNVQQGLSKAEVDQMLDEFLLECAQKEGGNADDIKFLKDRNLPVTKKQDCMVACIGENFDMVSMHYAPYSSLQSKIRQTDSRLIIYFKLYIINR